MKDDLVNKLLDSVAPENRAALLADIQKVGKKALKDAFSRGEADRKNDEKR